ncbi:hypothetical protein ARAM_006564 [Aspergillus rambellii]|uniref:Protein kinase n=1 Tax=Aspergillus rambellii TaxID=308745 RepID=A0A0F8VI17_9EURO|nr:hypothetical protein ARAM_006564 [Aspergillus rambellii]
MEATQESTQPCTDPRRMGRNNSGLLNEDLSDVICILHPNSPAAHDAVAATARIAPGHILQKDELEYEGSTAAVLDIALRLSSKVHDLGLGFCFGRNIARCDILLAADSASRRISNTHFRIYLTDDGILMLEDISTNGTIVDNCRLRKKEKDNSRMLTNGSVIQVINGDQSSDEIRFVVRFPSRDGHAMQYTENVLRYFDRVQKHQTGTVQPTRRQTPTPALQWANSYGMHWSGGSMYNVTGQIGKGAFATVYKLATKQHGAVYAAKELDKRRFVKNGILDRKVDNEMKIMRDLKHPNIVQFIDYQEHDRWIYIIMEYVPAGELSTYLQTEGKINEGMVKVMSRQILHALQYLHKRKITHRDIKPDNILIASHEPLKVKLSDFGLSKVVQEETFLKTFCGTLLYCAPEVYPEYENYRRGEVRKRRRFGDPPPKTSPYDQSVDMWSLGAVIYHLLAGIPPYTGRGDDRGTQMLRTIMTTDADYNVLRRAGVSEAGIDLVSKLLNRDPHLRAKERECLRHPWLVDVPDLDEYEEDMVSNSSEGLSDIGEDIEAELDASQLSLDDHPHLEAEQPESSNDLTQSKRPRIDSPPGDINYPSLPNIEISQDIQPLAESTPRRLFGEITSSALRSSHALGDGIISEDGDFSVHDFVSSLLNMNSWHPGTSKNPLLSAETPNRQPSEEIPAVGGKALGGELPNSPNATPKAIQFSRRIELPIPDTASERSSPETTTRKTSSHCPESTTGPGEIFDVELANTIDARSGQPVSEDRETQGFQPPADPSKNRVPAIPRLIGPPSKPRPLLGKLTTVPGSIFDLTLRLEDRMTSWGRGPQATICFPDPMDTRIPAYALEVTFWAPAIEARVASGQDWMTVPGVMAILSTKTRKCIWVNDTELRRGPEGDNNREGFHFGKLYSGDIITIYRQRSKFLKFQCEFYHGDSVRPRPEHEKGFKVRKVLMSKDVVANRQPVRNDRGSKE